MTSSPVERFATLAREYCTLVGGRQGDTGEGFTSKASMVRLGHLRAALCAAAFELPEAEPVSDRERTWPDPPQVARLGRFEWHLGVTDPYADVGATKQALSDDLADIYRDLASGLAEYERGDEAGVQDASFDWREGFLSHWGTHATSALHALRHAIGVLEQEGS